LHCKNVRRICQKIQGDLHHSGSGIWVDRKALERGEVIIDDVINDKSIFIQRVVVPHQDRRRAAGNDAANVGGVIGGDGQGR